MSNYMEEIAKTLDVEFEEEFDLWYRDELIRCRLTPYGIEYYEKDYEEWVDSYRLLREIFTDQRKIKKLWKPTVGQKYYIPKIKAGIPYATEIIWGDTFNDMEHYKTGMVCGAANEAVEKAQCILNALKGVCND